MIADATDQVGEIGLGVHAIQLATLDQGEEGRCALAAAVGPEEGPVAASERSRTVILPISGRTSKFVTDGTRFRGGVFVATTRSGGPEASSSTSKWSPAWSWWCRRGCSIRPRAPE